MKPTTTEDVLDLLNGATGAASLGAAFELGLFPLLAERPLDAAAVADALDLPARRCAYWLQVLSDTGLIVRDGDAYAPSATARAAILDRYRPDTWALLAEEARERMPALVDLALNLGVPGSVRDRLNLPPRDYMAQMAADPVRARRFTLMLYDLHRALAAELAASIDLDGASRLMDLGGGSGVVSLALVERHPGLSATVVDIANVCETGRGLAAERGLAERVTYHAADFLADPLPTCFDVVLACDVNVYSTGLFAKVAAALVEGGRFLIIDEFAPDDAAPPNRAHWALDRSLFDPDYVMPSVGGVKDLLRGAGLHLEDESPLEPLPGSERYREDLTVLTARR